jgi:hypothetical protein
MPHRQNHLACSRRAGPRASLLPAATWHTRDDFHEITRKIRKRRSTENDELVYRNVYGTKHVRRPSYLTQNTSRGIYDLLFAFNADDERRYTRERERERERWKLTVEANAYAPRGHFALRTASRRWRHARLFFINRYYPSIERGQKCGVAFTIVFDIMRCDVADTSDLMATV